MSDFVVMTQKEHREIKARIMLLEIVAEQSQYEVEYYKKVLKAIKHKSHKEFMDR